MMTMVFGMEYLAFGPNVRHMAELVWIEKLALGVELVHLKLAGMLVLDSCSCTIVLTMNQVLTYIECLGIEGIQLLVMNIQ